MSVEIKQVFNQIDIVEKIDDVIVQEKTFLVEIIQPSIIESGIPKSLSLASVEIDLSLVGSVSIPIAANEVLWPNIVGIFITQLDGSLTSQPVLSIGITGDLTRYRDKVLATSLDALDDRESFDIATSQQGDVGVTGTNLVLTVDTPAVLSSATLYKGKLFVSGLRIFNG